MLDRFGTEYEGVEGFATKAHGRYQIFESFQLKEQFDILAKSGDDELRLAKHKCTPIKNIQCVLLC